MSSNLRLDWCSYAAAKHAVLKWHYSKAMPAGKLASIGVWENDVFVGAVIFGLGANANFMKPFNLHIYEGCELVRVALKKHEAPVSQILGIALRMVRKQFPLIKVIVSYADPEQNHHGGIYQATNWIYLGESEIDKFPIVAGRVMHSRTLNQRIAAGWRYDRSKLDYVTKPGKHRYVYTFDDSIRERLKRISKPYPRAKYAMAPIQENSDGETPIRPLQPPQEE